MTPFASGRDADVFALDGHRVLRRYRAGGDVAHEVAIMVRLESLGYPVPHVFEAQGPDLVMQRLPGPTMLGAMTAGDLSLETGAALLADLHHRLHQTPFIHLDLHPDNVILTGTGPFVIDWRNAQEGEPDLDLAMTAVIVAQAALTPLPVAQQFLAAFLAAASGDPLRLLPQALARRAADPAMSGLETALLTDAEALITTLVSP
jgi:tRNA A-37 threonylcarbamoyl transferase component Bud32